MKYAVSARVGVLHAAIVSALSGAFMSPAVAQDEDEDGVGVETVIVTARFREESIQQTPIAITAVTDADITARGITASYEIANLVPNASLRPAQAAFGNTMTAFIRGIGQNDFDFAFEPGVGIYIDDVYHPFTLGSQMDLLDLERVEVLRGPQGTLFGRGSIGGAMRYITAKPEGDNTGSVEVTAGDYNRIDVRASYDFEAAENVFVRVAGVSRSREGYQDVIDFACAYPSLAGTTLVPQTINRGTGCRVGTQGGEDVTGARSTLRWAPSDGFELAVTADYLRDDSEAKADTLTLVNPGVWPSFIDIPYDDRFLPPNPYVSYATYDDVVSGVKIAPQSGMEKTMLSARADWYFGNDINLAVIAAYTDLTATLSSDADVSPINVQVVDGFQDIDYMTTEVRLTGLAFENLEWTVGAFYYDGESINNQMVSIPLLSLALDGVPPDQNASQPFVNARNVHQNRNESVFGHVVYDFNDRFSMNAGVRYSDDSKEVNFDNTRVQNPNVVVADDRTDWRLGFDYQVNPNFMAYISAATGYRPGSYNPRPFQATQVVEVDAEDSEAYEIGFKSDLADRKIRLNVAAFFTDWKTRILPVGGTECPLLDLGPPPVYDTVPPGTAGSGPDSIGNNCIIASQVPRTFYENGPGEVEGVEVEFLYYPTGRISFNAIYGLTNWDSEDINGDPNVISDRPAYVPEDNWSVGMAYETMLPGGGSFTPRLDVYGQSEICGTVVSATDPFPGASCSDGYELVSLRFEWINPDDTWRAAVGATNLTDEEYYLNKFDLTLFGFPHVEGQPGAPKEWYLSFKRNF